MKTGGHKGILCVYLLSLPVRGAWIEMSIFLQMSECSESLPVRGAWIEIKNSGIKQSISGVSLPVRGAWIEIIKITQAQITDTVAPCEGSVD